MITLLSTVVAPAFSAGALVLTPVYADQLPGVVRGVTRNLCGHPVTVGVLRELCPTLPAPRAHHLVKLIAELLPRRLLGPDDRVVGVPALLVAD